MRIRIVFPSTIVLLLCLISVAFAHPDKSLNNYVLKYDTLDVSAKQLERLAMYSHLINYFSRISYFKPNHKVSPDFIRALILAESQADRCAVSSKKALGLGQILHTTGREAAKEIYTGGYPLRYVDRERLADLQQKDLFDPAINILLTCYLISKYNDKFDGKLELVVSAWNAGEYVKSLKVGRPAPYSETYNLIGKINGYYRSLQQRRMR